MISNKQTIKCIKLNNNGLGIGGGKFIAKALVASVKNDKDTAINTIVIGRNRLENEGAFYLGKAFRLFENLTEIRMPQNGIRKEGIVFLMESLMHCKSLKVLDLQDNTFTTDGSIACAKALTFWKDLNVLNIGECLLGTEGSIIILKSLIGTHGNLTKLMLSFNEMDSEGARLIPSVLENKPYITILELNGNEFDPEGEEVDQIKNELSRLGQPDALDVLDEMEWECD